jgi:hypothetical protein
MLDGTVVWQGFTNKKAPGDKLTQLLLLLLLLLPPRALLAQLVGRRLATATTKPTPKALIFTKLKTE